MDIEGVNEKTILQLHEKLGINSFIQLYSLTKQQLLTLDGFKDKKADNLLASVERSKDRELPAVINALGIGSIGKKHASDLANKYKSLENLQNADEEELAQMPDFGLITAREITDYFRQNPDIVQRLKDNGISPKHFEQSGSGSFSGQNVVLTGTLPNYSRFDAGKMIEKAGGTLQSSVGKSTTIVVAGENAGSKLSKARELGIKIIDEKELLEMLKKS
jgi:DNA ligase (NAD+)